MTPEQYRPLYQSALKTDSGRALLFHIIEKGNIYNAGYEDDPYKVQYNEGRKSVIIEIITELQSIDPKTYIHLLDKIGDLS